MPIYEDKKRGTYYISEYVNGRRIMRRGFKSERAAKTALKDVLLLKAGISSRITFAQVYALFLEAWQQGKKGGTIQQMEFMFKKHLEPTFGHMKMEKITSLDILSWKKEMQNKGLSSSTLNRALMHLKMIMGFAEKHLALKDNPADKVDRFAEDIEDDTIKFITYDDFFKGVEAVQDSVLRTAYKVLFLEGLRQGELFALKVKDVNFNFKKITVNKSWGIKKDQTRGIISTKNKSSTRTVDMLDKTAELLKEHISYHGLKDDDFVFLGSKPLTRVRFYNHFVEAFLGLSPHSLRHSHISWLIDIGVDLMTIARRVGHKNTIMIQKTYGHLYEEKLRTSMKLINEASKKDSNTTRDTIRDTAMIL